MNGIILDFGLSYMGFLFHLETTIINESWWCFMAAVTKHQPWHYGLHVEDESISSAIDAHN